jgi:CRP/FNR family transcriptional regulator
MFTMEIAPSPPLPSRCLEREIRVFRTPTRLEDRFGQASTRRLEAREHVFCEGDPRTHVFQVEQGAIVLYKVLPDGRRQVFDFAYPGDLIGLGTSREHVFNAQATGPAKVRCLAAQALEEAASRDASLALKLYKAVSVELAAARRLIVSIGQRSALERVAAFLFMLYRRDNGDAYPESAIELPMRRSDIADLLGLTIETVSRTLTKLRATHVIDIVHGTTVHVRNASRLEALAGGQ